jgi:hypothetical protein
MDMQTSVTWRMPVGVVDFDDPRKEDIVILGCTGFLQFFNVRFLGSEHFVELLPNADFQRAFQPATA